MINLSNELTFIFKISLSISFTIAPNLFPYYATKSYQRKWNQTTMVSQRTVAGCSGCDNALPCLAGHVTSYQALFTYRLPNIRFWVRGLRMKPWGTPAKDSILMINSEVSNFEEGYCIIFKETNIDQTLLKALTVHEMQEQILILILLSVITIWRFQSRDRLLTIKLRFNLMSRIQ